MFNLDIGSAVVKFFAEWKKAKRAHKCGRLLFGMLFSGVIAFLWRAGDLLAAGSAPWVAIGNGMTASAVVLLALFVASPLTRKMAISIPSVVVEKMHKEGQTTIHRE